MKTPWTCAATTFFALALALAVPAQDSIRESRSPGDAVISEAMRDGDSVRVHEVRSPYQGGTTHIKVLTPDRQEKGERFPVVFVLPVEAGSESRYGDGVKEVRKLDLHNRHRAIFVAPTFSHLPWYADHPTNAEIRQETYFLKVVVPFVERTYPVRAEVESRLLLGFSKSGWGAYSLLLRHPDVFGRAAAWDAPLMMDRPGRYGSGPIFGTPENFAGYRISALLEARAADLKKEKRLILLGYGSFRDEHRQAHTLMDRLQVAHEYRDGPARKHDWHSGWVTEAAELLLGKPNGSVEGALQALHYVFRTMARMAPPPPASDDPKDFPAAKSPEEALASMKVRPGLKVELVAAEPLVMDPVDIAWGADGKLWVVEMADYPLGLDGKGKPGGRVRFLEDTDGDGRYDRSTLFLDGIPYPTGVMPWRRGVLVTAAPSIFYAEDTDGDGKADVQQPLYTGFGEGNQQHRVNGLRWGLDNWIHVANGDSDGKIRSTKTDRAIDVRGRDLRIRPDDGDLDAQAGRAQFGRNRDDWDNWFGCNNSNPMWHYVLTDHYLRRNPHVAPPRGLATVQVSVNPGAAPVYPVSHTVTRFNDFDRANRFTSACGAMVYRDNLLGASFAGNAFVCEPVHNLVHREILSPKGVTFTSRRADDEQNSEFLASTDNWFRPTVVHAGPDGALYVVDMYRFVIEHPQWIPADWQRKLDLRAGHDRGRIYRIVPVGQKRPRAVPRLDRLDPAGLVAALDSPSGWQRDTAQQLLLWSADREASPLLRKLAASSKNPLARLHALCTLDGPGALQPDDVRRALNDDHPGVRRHGIRLSERFLNEVPELGAALLARPGDEDPQVQMQLAYSLGAWRDARASRALATLAVRHQADPYLLIAVLSSLHEGNVSETLAAVLADRNASGPLRERLLRLTASLGDERVLGRALALVCTANDAGFAPWQYAALAGILEALDARPTLRDRLLTPDAREKVGKVFIAARKLTGRDSAAEEDRRAAMQLLARGRDDADLAALTNVLTPRNSPELQEAALAALAQIPQTGIAGRLLHDWDTHSPRLRSQMIEVLLSRDFWARQLLAHIEQGKVPAGQLDAVARQRLLQHRDEAIRKSAAKLLADAGNPDRKRVLERYQSVRTMKGDAERGRAVFKQHCSACHKLDDIGHEIGPDLTALTDRSTRALLTAILDPNEAVEDKFTAYFAATVDGRTHNGMLAAETGTSITLRAGEGKEQVILRTQLEELRNTGKSLMPEGVEKDIKPEQMADLIAYVAKSMPARKVFAGNEPMPIRPASDGTLELPATRCAIYGKTLIFEPKSNSLEWWTSPDDRAVWEVEVPRAGKYAVSLLYSCAGSSAGNEYVVMIGEEKLRGKVSATAHWIDFQLRPVGEVTLPAGKQQILVSAGPGLKKALFDLKSVRLVPMK